MITSRKVLQEYLVADYNAYKRNAGLKGLFRHLMSSPISDQRYIWKYIKTLRYAEYWINKYNSYRTPMALWYLHKLRKYGRITGFQIHPNTLGKGVQIWHYGTIIINSTTRIGDNCIIRPDVLIGHKTMGEQAARIGNNVEINSGARIIGDITIGDDVVIGVNAVVNKSIPSHCIVAGVPATIIKVRNSSNEKWSNLNVSHQSSVR